MRSGKFQLQDCNPATYEVNGELVVCKVLNVILHKNRVLIVLKILYVKEKKKTKENEF